MAETDLHKGCFHKSNQHRTSLPDPQLLVTVPAPPTLAELETAQALVTLQEPVSDDTITMSAPDTNPGKDDLPLQEPNVLPVPETIDLPIEGPP